jgi:hypothetical protein
VGAARDGTGAVAADVGAVLHAAGKARLAASPQKKR